MKFRRVYVIDGIPSEEFHEKNATDIDHFRNEGYWLMSCEQGFNDEGEELCELKSDLSNDEIEDLPF